MSERAPDLARALREAFDRAFAEPASEKPVTVGLLAVRLGDDPYALRVDEIAGLHRDKPVTHTASALPEFVGLAGFKGGIVPVYDLAALLGYPRSDASRWLVVARGAVPIALAFEKFEAHLAIERDRLSWGAGPSTRPYLAGALHESEGVRALIRIDSIVEATVSRVRFRDQ